MDDPLQPTLLSTRSPEAKRKKLDSDTTHHDQATEVAAAAAATVVPIEAILPDSLIKPIIYERCVIATLGDKRRLSEFIREINKSFPLPTFQHLKRVKNDQVLLFPETTVQSTIDSNFEDLVKAVLVDRGFPESLINVCSKFTVEELCAVSPQLKCQYEKVITRWPCKFHEDKALEKLSRNENFNGLEIQFHCRMMELCFKLRPTLQSECVALTFDPTKNEIVALGWRPPGNDELLRLMPSGHAVMRAIDNMSVYQGGGAWRGDDTIASTLLKGLATARSEFKDFSELHLKPQEELKYGSYLCTGVDMYLTDESCLMCSMAMVHSRVRRIFFRRNNDQNGALGGGNQLKLHGVKELNHHFQVFRINDTGSVATQMTNDDTFYSKEL